MKQIPLANAFEFLAASPAIILEGRALNHTLSDLVQEPDNEFLHLHWHEYGLDFEVIFEEGANEYAEIEGQFLRLVNNEGILEELELLAEYDVESLLEY